MVKQYLAAVLEDLIGEYVLNISKENLKLAALQGKIKLDNVELDGDYIGSHVLGAVGLQGFGVLSCWARSLQINIPWKNLNDPTSIEIHSMHLVCVPLLPTTATRIYYGGGISCGSCSSQASLQDVPPRCSLRTRAKRSAIARFERNFLAGRIPGEGPQIEKEKGDGKILRYNGRSRLWSVHATDDGNGPVLGDYHTGSMHDVPADHVSNGHVTSNKDPEQINGAACSSKQTFKEKISSKIFQNLISSVNDVHIRFEVPEGGLNMSLTGKHGFNTRRSNNAHRESFVDSDHRAFAFGLTLQRLSVQNVSEDAQKNETISKESDDKACKTIEIRNMSIYWDDGPSFLLTESDLMKGLISVPVQKLQKRIAEVMKQMSLGQDPGDDLKRKLCSLNSPARVLFVRKHSNSDYLRSHDYICANISQKIHTTFSPGPLGVSSYLLELLPCKLEIDITSRQYRQYQLLKNAVLSQQRFDTMLHGRPKESPLENPRSWWRYAILCVQHRPNSRPWSDVQQIVQCRKKYINLVVKNLQSETDQSGFHGGLSSSESQALLELESFLPIETLLAFHLLALREVLNNRCDHKTIASAKAGLLRKSRGSNSISRLWKSVSGSKSSSWRPLEDFDCDAPTLPSFPPKLSSSCHASTNVLQERESILDDYRVVDDATREPSTETTCRLEMCEIRICLLDFLEQTKIVTMEVAMKGYSFDSGEGKEEYVCEILRFEVFDFISSGAHDGKKVLSVQPSFQGEPKHQVVGTTIVQIDNIADDQDAGTTPAIDRVSSTSITEDQLLHVMSSHENDLPVGIVCRVTAYANEDELSLAFVAHPATIVWNNACAEAVADFFSTSTPDVKSQFLNQLRSAATPSAHKRQIELLFPTSLSITIDIDAPKLWVPVSSQTIDGALYLDAGKLKMAAIKPKKTSVTRWELDLSDIQIKFSRGATGHLPETGKCDEAIDLVAVNRLENEFTVIYPFHIGATGFASESIEIPLESYFPSNLDEQHELIAAEVSATVSKICLNLVDVEELAKAVGRFYASEMIRMKTKAKEYGSTNSPSESQIKSSRKPGPSSTDFSPNLPAVQILVSFEEIEVALESYEPAKNVDKMLSTRNRTYLIEIFRITLHQRSKGLKQFSRLTVSDFSIVQLTEIKRDGCRMPRLPKPSHEPQHQILGKKVTSGYGCHGLHENSDISPLLTPNTKTRYHPLLTPREMRLPSAWEQTNTSEFPPIEFIRACHFHDGENHVDEVEVDVSNMIVRVTPTSIVDLKISLTRLFELIQLTSKEMERKVHEGRRRAIRAYKSRSTLNGLYATAIYPSASLPEEEYGRTDNRRSETDDSSVIFRVTFKDVSLFVGRPASEFTSSRASKRHGSAPHDYVVQILTNASVLVQSIENPDASGSKTVHVSLEDFSASISNSWTDKEGSNRVVSPTEFDFRAVYQTVDEGSVVCQDLSVNCESLKCCMRPHDVTVILSIARKVAERLQALRTPLGQTAPKSNARMGLLPSLVYVKQRGSGIATNVRFDLNRFSFVSIHAFKVAHTRPFLDLSIDQLKMRLDGVAACLTGELSAVIKLSFFHPITGWEHLIEPFQMHVDIEQMPEEQIFTVTSVNVINMNFTGYLLQELSNLERSRKHNSSSSETSSALANPGSSITFANYTGIDLYIGMSSLSRQGPTENPFCIQNGESVALESLFPELTDIESPAMSLTALQRKTLSNLPLVPSSERSAFLFKWHSLSKPTDNRCELYDLEPVVEFVMQNQRLQSSVADVFSLEKGRDLIESTIWSPEFHSHDDTIASSKSSKYLWQKPYLDGDAPEFSDVTSRLRCTKDSFILPGNDWIWVDDWEVEINDGLGVTNDADGWEYEADFDTFTAARRCYKRGDACRRRRWARHRILKPPKLDDPLRFFPVVWELKKEENGSTKIKARSHLTLYNQTSIPLAFFGHCVCWEEDHFIGCANPGLSIYVPLHLASATHLRLAVPKNSSSMHDLPTLQIAECFASNRVMILSSGIDSNRILRTSILCDDSSTDRNGLRSLRNLHFLLRLTSDDGVCNIHVDPALTLINLLPCQVQCQLAESIRYRGLKGRKVVQTEEISIAVGKEAKCLSLNCRLKPHISIRLPGYRWSSWTRIVNRRANSQTWLPLHEEQLALFDAYKDDVEHDNEYKTIVHLDNKCTGGASINLIMSVQTGHSPTLHFYSQYWILDKTGCGLRFTDNFDITGSTPDTDTLRKSYLSVDAANNSSLATDIKRQGYEWSLGMNGMTLFFSRRERVSFSVVTDEEDSSALKRPITSRWSKFIDISKVMPKTVISVDDHDGSKRFELAYNVTLCPSVFSRTMIITFFPRYQIANLLPEGLFVAQQGALDAPLSIPSQSWVPFHWENSSMPPKIRISSQTGKEPGLWSRGCIALDQIGITAIRVPSAINKKTVVVQVEVRLATKKQSSAAVVVIWSAKEKSNPLYTLRNSSDHTIFCSQPLLHDSSGEEGSLTNFECFSREDIAGESHHKIAGALGRVARKHQSQGIARESNLKTFVKKVLKGECSDYNISDNFYTGKECEEFVWTLPPGESIGFGFDDPEMPHILEWTCMTSSALLLQDSDVGCIDVDKIGSTSSVALLDGDEVKCEIKAEQSTKVVVFSNATVAENVDPYDDLVSLTFRIALPGIAVSIIDNICHTEQGRSSSDHASNNNESNTPKEIMLITTEGWICNFSQTRDSSHELEVKLDSMQVDNFIFNAEHPVLVFTPKRDNEPFLHCSIVRRLNDHESTLVISYAALRVLEIDICLDRKTAETLANFLHPFRKARERGINIEEWISTLTLKMSSTYSKRNRRAPRDIEKMIHSANSGRLYVEHLHLHPIRLSLTFTQEWLEWNPATEGLIIFQLIRGMASIADAPLTFTSFLVGNAFESPQSLIGIIQAHYSSQLTNQILTILGSLAILKAPVEFVSNIGSGVIRFFYEPINALVHSPEHFFESIESGTHHLARGVLTGFVRGAANLTYLVNNNLVTLASDEAFADTRRAYQKQLASSRTRSIEDSLSRAGACVARGFQSGANGIFEQPAIYSSRHGAVGLVKGVGKALVGAIIKPVVGVGDAAVVVMNHVSDAASEKAIVMKTSKRMRRALPRNTKYFGSSVNLVPYDTISAKAQQIVTGGETVDDAYLGHVTTPSHLIIASKQCLWAIDNDSREPWCISWTEISHFSIDRGNSLTITVFSAQGPQSYVFDMPPGELAELCAILSTQMLKMGNMNPTGASSHATIQGMRSPQVGHIFGSMNKDFKIQPSDLEDEVKLLEQCYSRVAALSSSSSDFFIRLDQEAWLLVNSWSQMFTGLSSRRCIAVGMLNGTLETIQVKLVKLSEGGSPCYIIPTSEYDKEHGTLSPGGAIIVFGWGVAPSLLQPGRVLINIETNAFACSMPDRKEQLTTIQSLPGYHVGFLEKSYDENGWWAKYWILIQHDQHSQIY